MHTDSALGYILRKKKMNNNLINVVAVAVLGHNDRGECYWYLELRNWPKTCGTFCFAFWTATCITAPVLAFLLFVCFIFAKAEILTLSLWGVQLGHSPFPFAYVSEHSFIRAPHRCRRRGLFSEMRKRQRCASWWWGAFLWSPSRPRLPWERRMKKDDKI